MKKNLQNAGKSWTSEQIKMLKDLAKRNTPTGLIAYKEKRTEDAIRSKASEIGLSLDPTNKSPYGPRRKK